MKLSPFTSLANAQSPMKKLLLLALLYPVLVFAEKGPTEGLLEECKANTISCHWVMLTITASRVMTKEATKLALKSLHDAVGIESTTEEVIDFQKLITDASVEAYYGCPKGKTLSQMSAIFVKWAEEHPEKWHQSLAASFIEAFSATSPNGLDCGR